MLAHILSSIFDLATGRQKPHVEKDFEILVLWCQRLILRRILPHRPCPSPPKRLVLAALAAKLKNLSLGVDTPGVEVSPLQTRDGLSVAPRPGSPQVALHSLRHSRKTADDSRGRTS